MVFSIFCFLFLDVDVHVEIAIISIVCFLDIFKPFIFFHWHAFSSTDVTATRRKIWIQVKVWKIEKIVYQLNPYLNLNFKKRMRREEKRVKERTFLSISISSNYT